MRRAVQRLRGHTMLKRTLRNLGREADDFILGAAYESVGHGDVCLRACFNGHRGSM
jgi:hypothetical protein